MPSFGHLVAYCTLGVLQGVLVLLPRPVGPSASSRLRSPGWAFAFPGALIVGTFGVLDVARGATALAALAAVTTPVLAIVAALRLVRGRRGVWIVVPPGLAAAAVALHAWPAQIAASTLTALACLAVGVTLVRLTPLPWLGGGIAAMCVVDVALLAIGVGEPAAHLMQSALSHGALPRLDRAQLGSATKDYPDLVLAAALGSVLAGHRRQLTAALLVAALSCADGVSFLFVKLVPATVPVGLAAAAVVLLERRSRRVRRPARDRVWAPALPHPPAWPEVEPAEG